MNLVDSSGWLEYFIDGKNAEVFAKPLHEFDRLIVPTICIYEVFKVVLRERGEEEALQAVALMKKGQTVTLTEDIALQAAKLSHERQLHMADSIILATARVHGATVWTQDKDLDSFPDVKYFPKH